MTKQDPANQSGGAWNCGKKTNGVSDLDLFPCHGDTSKRNTQKVLRVSICEWQWTDD